MNDAISAAFDEIRRIDLIMSLHRADSELASVNATAGENAQSVSEDLFHVLDKAMAIAAVSEGSFDPTIGPLVRLWGFLWNNPRLPNKAELDGVLQQVGHEYVKLDPRKGTVAFTKGGITLDLNGIAKGYAVDCAIRKLQEFGVSNAMVRAGGDLRVTGAPPGQHAWSVQIEDPNKRGARQTIHLRDAAVSTSGSYENFFELDGRRYSHILDPRNGLPIQGIAACTVVAPTCMESDAWATALFVLGPQKSAAKFKDLAFRFVLASGEVIANRHFPVPD